MSTPAKQQAELRPTPGQTVGPFFKFGLEFDGMREVVHPHSPGAVMLSGRVLDGEGAPLPDALVEIFGADADGAVPDQRGSLKRDGRGFTGFGRAPTDDEGRFYFWTREPGAVGGTAPFFAVVLFARGLPSHLHTRIYLPEHSQANVADPLLQGLTDAERATLVATRDADGHLHHDIHLQGERETVFLAY